MTSLQTALLCAKAADHRKGEEILVLNVSEVSSLSDYYVIVTGSSEPHLKAIRNEVEHQLSESGVSPVRIDGFPSSQWIVIDYIDVVVHVFDVKTRDFYGLERLWGDAPRVEW